MSNYYFQDPSFEFETRGLIGNVHFGCGDIGEIMTVVEAVEDGNDESWVAEWEALAERIEAIADEVAAQGHQVSARGAYLRASSYYAASLVAIDGLADPEAKRGPLFAAHRRCFDAHVARLPVPAEQMSIAYDGDVPMPAYFFRPSTDGAPRPTLIVNNGSDAGLTYLHPGMVQPGLDRGYNVLIFDGPGQQSMLFDRNIPFRADWENVITPIVDLLVARSDVDADRVAIYGISQGGYWVPRAAAFEHRLAAAVADPGVDDVMASWRPNISPPLLELLDAGDHQGFEDGMAAMLAQAPAKMRQMVAWRMKPFGQPDAYTTFKAVEEYHLTPEMIGQITTPVLIADPEGESFWPGQAKRLFDALPEPKAYVPFTAAEGADLHIEPMARSLVVQRVFDWLDDTLGRKA